MSLRLIAIFTILPLFSMSCGARTQGDIRPSPTPPVMTSTLPAAPTSILSEPTLSSPSPPSVAFVDGVTSTQVNVRAQPSTASEVIGMIPAEMRIEIIGKDPGGNWWQINYPQGADGKGWVTAQYITTASHTEVPIVGGAEPGATSGNVAVVQQQINVRSGPGTDFNSLGTLNPQDVVSLKGKDENGAWLQIDFPAGPEGKGWVNAAFIQAQGAENLPIVAASGLVIGTGTPTGIPPTVTPTRIPAREDHDSADRPVASVILDPAGTKSFLYMGDISSPQGDLEDWIAFQPYEEFIFVSLMCQGGDSVEAAIIERTAAHETSIRCHDTMKRVAVNPGANHWVHLRASESAETLQYINYILTIKTRP